jgi:hypothetical protein
MTPDRRPVVILSASLRPVRGRAGLRSNEWHGVLAWKDPAEAGQPYDGQPVHLSNPLIVIADGGVEEVMAACQAATLPDYAPDVPASSSDEEFKRVSLDLDGVTVSPDVLEAAKGTLLHQAVVLTDGRRGLVIEEHDALKGVVDVMLESGELAERVQVREIVSDEQPEDRDEESGNFIEESTNGDNESKKRDEESDFTGEAEQVTASRKSRRVRQARTTE